MRLGIVGRVVERGGWDAAVSRTRSEGFETDVAEDFPDHGLWTLAMGSSRLGCRITGRQPRYRKPC